MKILKTLALAGTMAMMAGTGFAATVQAEHKGTSGVTNNLSITYGTGKKTTKNIAAGEFTMLGTAGEITGDFAAFCVDVITSLASGKQTYTVKNDLFNSTIVGKVQTLFDANYSETLSKIERAAFQIALWQTIRTDVTYSYTGSDKTLLKNTVNQFKNATYSGPSLWDLTFLVGNPKTQNLVAVDKAPQPAPVPLPAAGFLLLGGLGGLGIVARRRTNAA